MLDQQLVVGRTYRFTFKLEFERHGVCSPGVTCLHSGNGVFRIEQIATFPDIALAGINLYENFFQPLGISTEQYLKYFTGMPDDEYEATKAIVPVHSTAHNYVTVNDNGEIKTVLQRVVTTNYKVEDSGVTKLKRQFFNELNYGRNNIYKLIDVTNPEDILYAPELSILGVPEIGILEYQDMTMSIDLGYVKDPASLDGLLHDVRERLALHGVQPLKIDMLSSDSKWMNNDEYTELKSFRVPGKLVKITAANKPNYVNQYMIRYGKLIQLVTSLPSDTAVLTMYDGTKLNYRTDQGTGEQVYFMDINKIKTIPGFNIDPYLFIREMDPWNDSTVYEASKEYYLKEVGDNGSIFRKLVEGSDWAPGEVISLFKVVDTNGLTNDSKSYFTRDSSVSYTQLPLDDNYEAATAKRAEGVTLYVKTITDTDSWAGVTHVTVEANTDDTTYEYRKSGVLQHYTVGQVISDLSGLSVRKIMYTAVARDEELNAETLYFIKQLPVYNVFLGEQFASGVVYYARNPIYLVDYANQDAVNYIGAEFRYTNLIGAQTTVDVSADTLIELSGHASDTVMISNDIVKRRYLNRWFEYTYYKHLLPGDIRDNANRPIYTYVDGEWHRVPEADLGVVGAPYGQSNYYCTATVGRCITDSDSEIRVSVGDRTEEGVDNGLVQGVVLGETGDLENEVYIKDATLNRNYYALYQTSLREQTRLTAEIEALRTTLHQQYNTINSLTHP